MRLVDTSAWIEWLVRTPISAVIAAEIPQREDWLVPTIVQLELAKWLRREVGEEKADQVIAFSETCMVADLDRNSACGGGLLHPAQTGDRGRNRVRNCTCLMVPTC